MTNLTSRRQRAYIFEVDELAAPGQSRRWRAGGLEVRKYPVAVTVDDADDATPPPTTHGSALNFFTISYYARGTRGEGALC